jgi:hypothetical protein
MDIEIIDECKKYIEENNIDYFQQFILDTIGSTDHEREPDWPYIFHKVYLHACLRGRDEMAQWLQLTIHPRMDPIQQIALRQIFSYGRVLLEKARKKRNQE